MGDEATLRDALQRLIDAVWQRPSRAAFTIPADPERDADLLLSDAIDELVRLRAALAAERKLADDLYAALDTIRPATRGSAEIRLHALTTWIAARGWAVRKEGG